MELAHRLSPVPEDAALPDALQPSGDPQRPHPRQLGVPLRPNDGAESGVRILMNTTRKTPTFAANAGLTYTRSMGVGQLSRAELIQEMRRRGIRVTAQRLAVAELLAGTDEHLTAQEIYRRLQQRLPHITMGTVYNTLDALAKGGFVQPLPFPQGTRYDANPEPHTNLICLCCGSIVDVPDMDGTIQRLREAIARTTRFRVESQRVDFYGLCARCAADNAPAPEAAKPTEPS